MQKARIRQLICEQCLEQLKMEFALWNQISGRGLILREYGIALHVRSVSKLLARWMIIEGAFNHEKLIEFL